MGGSITPHAYEDDHRHIKFRAFVENVFHSQKKIRAFKQIRVIAVEKIALYIIWSCAPQLYRYDRGSGRRADIFIPCIACCDRCDECSVTVHVFAGERGGGGSDCKS